MILKYRAQQIHKGDDKSAQDTDTTRANIRGIATEKGRAEYSLLSSEAEEG